MKAIRAFLLITIAAIALAALQRCVVVPYRCNLDERWTTKAVYEMERREDQRLRVVRLARENIRRLSPCLDHCPDDVGITMVAAASYRFLGDPETAASLYERALRYDRRPELYFNLGMALIEAGHVDRAVAPLSQACVYDPKLLDAIGVNHSEARRAVEEYQKRLTGRR